MEHTDNNYPTPLKEANAELMALRDKQAARFEEIKSVTDPDKKSALKEACKAAITEIEEKQQSLNEELKLWQQEQANREALKAMREPDRRIPFSAEGGNPLNPNNTYGDAQAPCGMNGYGMNGANGSAAMKTLGDLIIESPEYKSGLPGIKSAAFNIELRNVTGMKDAIKTEFTTSAGIAPFGERLPGFVPIALRVPVFADLIPQRETNNGIFYYLEETTHTNNAAYVAQAGTKPENAYALTSRTVTPAKIATTIPAAEEVLEDVEQAREFLNNRLAFDISYAEESALLNFTVGSNGWDGFLQKSGVQTQSAATDPVPTAVLKGMTLVQYSPGFAGMATGIAMNPTDWQNVLTLQESTGAYIWSAPSAPVQMPDMRMWGMTVRAVAALTQGTALLGNFLQFSQIWRRAGLSIRVAYANDDALKNLVRLIAEERLALVISRAAAFCKITSIPA